MKKYIYISLGILCVILGGIGVVTPVLPTTPFLLLAAFLFSRSSKKMHDMLLKNKVFGKYLYNYSNHIPFPLKDKIFSIAFLWTGLSATFYFADLPKWVFILLIVIGISVSIHIAMLGKWRRNKNTSSTNPPSQDPL
ncbi:MAG: YbaN family protein [Fibromonadales bacterium]|nr:YbaN family protein [Fibromonadales bacterium]